MQKQFSGEIIIISSNDAGTYFFLILAQILHYIQNLTQNGDLNIKLEL